MFTYRVAALNWFQVKHVVTNFGLWTTMEIPYFSSFFESCVEVSYIQLTISRTKPMEHTTKQLPNSLKDTLFIQQFCNIKDLSSEKVFIYKPPWKPACGMCWVYSILFVINITLNQHPEVPSSNLCHQVLMKFGVRAGTIINECTQNVWHVCDITVISKFKITVKYDSQMITIIHHRLKSGLWSRYTRPLTLTPQFLHLQPRLLHKSSSSSSSSLLLLQRACWLMLQMHRSLRLLVQP